MPAASTGTAVNVGCAPTTVRFFGEEIVTVGPVLSTLTVPDALSDRLPARSSAATAMVLVP